MIFGFLIRLFSSLLLINCVVSVRAEQTAVRRPAVTACSCSTLSLGHHANSHSALIKLSKVKRHFINIFILRDRFVPFCQLTIQRRKISGKDKINNRNCCMCDSGIIQMILYFSFILLLIPLS